MRKNVFSIALIGSIFMGGAFSCVVNAQSPLMEPVVVPHAVAVPKRLVPVNTTRANLVPALQSAATGKLQAIPAPRANRVVATGRIVHNQNSKNVKAVSEGQFALPVNSPSSLYNAAYPVTSLRMSAEPIPRPSMSPMVLPTPAPVPQSSN